jgi:hypothetical protein
MRQSMVRIMLSCLLLLVSLYTVKPADVFACSCAGPPTVEESLERSAAIFAGEVTKLVGPKPRLVMSSADPVQVTLEVTEVWKGELAGMTELTTAVSSSSCGYDQFAVGSEFLVFASAESGQLRTGMCDGTKLLSTATKELTELGDGYPPDDASAECWSISILTETRPVGGCCSAAGSGAMALFLEEEKEKCKANVKFLKIYWR